MSTLIQQGPLALFAAMLVMHALADFPLQGGYLATRKNRDHAGSRSEWLVALSAHCVIQGGGVWLVTGSLAFAAVETVLHGCIDLAKSEGKIGLVTDQLLHLACKAGYVAVMALCA